MNKYRASGIAGLLVLFQLISQSAYADGELSFESIELADTEFVYYPSQSANGLIRVYGDSWSPLSVSTDSGNSYQSVNASEAPYPDGMTPEELITYRANWREQIDWKQVSVSPSGERIIASSARGNSGGYVFLSTDSGSSFERLDALGNANWTGAIFGTNPDELLVLDGVATIWGNAADGSNCDSDECLGSGENGSNLQGHPHGGMVIQEQPFALVRYSQDLGATWSDAVTVPTGGANVGYSITSTENRFLLRKSEPENGNQYFELKGLARNQTQNLVMQKNQQAEEVRIKKVVSSRALIVDSLKSGRVLTIDELINADFDGISNKTIEGFNREVASLSTTAKDNLSSIQTLVQKWASVDKVLSGRPVTFNDLVASGMAPSELPHKSLVLRALRGAALNQIDSVERVHELINLVVKENQARRDRLKVRLLANS
jgi:hypothetical protein